MDLKSLYEKMAQLTEPECRLNCRCPQSCCDEMYCRIAEEWAKQEGVVLERTGHPTIPFMGPKGCVVPPHLRPICTLHVCAINGMGFKANDPEFNKKYFELRGQIEDIEYRRMR